MLETWTTLSLFPSNGLDRSLHAPIFVGLLLLSFFRETLGWSYAGLVVPGYLATVFVAAPTTGGLVVGESILTYALAALLGRVLPRTGAWFTFFGRERFLLLIVVASLVRLVIEGSVLPLLTRQLGLAHSRELYSLGLVLVPLLSNAYWNVGLVRGFPRTAVVTALTYLVVVKVLLRYTNFTVSRFQVANESVSLAFLESPHAHIILLLGAVLAARNNVKYGWDYNGILVPALLGVAWYQPTKVATTLMEGLIVYGCSLLAVRLPPLSKVNVVGSRRLLVAFSIGLLLKFVLGFATEVVAPSVQLVDYFGFGYILPSLLAVKIWDKGHIWRVLIPTVQVSLIAFPVGNLIGFGLREWLQEDRAAPGNVEPVATQRSVPLLLMLGDSAPAPQRTTASGTSHAAVLEYLARLYSDDPNQQSWSGIAGASLAVYRPDADWLTLTPQTTDPHSEVLAPRLAVRTPQTYSRDWLVVVETSAVGDPLTTLGFGIGETLGARAVVLRSHRPSVRLLDDEFVRRLTNTLRASNVLLVRSAQTSLSTRLSVVGQVPPTLAQKGLGRYLEADVEIEFRAAPAEPDLFDAAPTLELHDAFATGLAARKLGQPSVSSWGRLGTRQLLERLQPLTRSPQDAHRILEVPELRLLGAGVLGPRLATPEQAPSPWTLALANALGYRFATAELGSARLWVLHEPDGVRRRGLATLVQRARRPAELPVLVGVPAPGWEGGTLSSGVALFSALQADGFVVHGAQVNLKRDGSADPRKPQGRHCSYQRVHEVWLNGGGSALTVRAVPPGQALSTRAVLTLDAELQDVALGPAWIKPVVSFLEVSGISVKPFDGTAERAGLSASLDPAIEFGRRFAEGRSAVLWLDEHVRGSLLRSGSSELASARLRRLGITYSEAPLLSHIRGRLGCQQPEISAQHCTPEQLGTCDVRQALAAFEEYDRTGNPYTLAQGVDLAVGCDPAAITDPSTMVTWVSLSERGRALYLVPLRGTRPPRVSNSIPVSSTDPTELRAAGLAALRPIEVRL